MRLTLAQTHANLLSTAPRSTDFIESTYEYQTVDVVKEGDKLDFAAGKGDDPDVAALTFVMDSEKFPFYQGEVYHQFHDGFKFGEDYPSSYNGLAKKLLASGTVKDQGCPNGMLGVGCASHACTVPVPQQLAYTP